MATAKQTPKKTPHQIARGVKGYFARFSMGLSLAVFTAAILGLHVIAILFAIPMTISLILTIVWDKKARKLRDSY